MEVRLLACLLGPVYILTFSQKLWPTAMRIRALLEGAKVRLDDSTYTMDIGQAGRRKRNVEDALGSSKNSDINARNMYGMPVVDGYADQPATSAAWDHAHNARMVAQSLGIGPSAEASTSFYPGYQWWPSQLLTTEGLTHMALSAPMDLPSVSAPMSYSAMTGYTHPPQHVPHSGPHAHHTQHAQSQEPFTFGQGDLSRNFVQNVNYPNNFSFSRYSTHPGDHGHDLPPQQ